MEHYSVQDQRCREELRLRDVSGWQRLAAEQVLDFTLRRGLAAVRMTVEDFADSLGTDKGNLYPSLKRLVLFDILRRDERAALWWINAKPSTWKVPRRIPADDAERVRRAARAQERILRHNPLQPDQHELFEPEQTDAEAQAEAALDRAADSPTSGLPPALADQPAPVRYENHNAGYDFHNKRSENHNKSVVKITTNGGEAPPPTHARQSQAKTKPGSEPGKPGASTSREEAREKKPLSAEAFALLEEMEEWCAQGPEGPDMFEQYRSKWEGRLRWKPGLVERVFSEAKANVQVRKSRGGSLDSLFRVFLDGSQTTAAPAPKVAVVPKPTAQPEPPPDWEKNQELARRCAEELRQKLGKQQRAANL